MSHPRVYNVNTWLEKNRQYFLPPICNKLMHDEQLKIFFVGGPNIREDFHIEEGEELFFMLKGEMCLKVYANSKFQDVIIKEGELFLLPARILHSPQRKRDTVGMVIERERLPHEKDCLRYHVTGTDEVLFEQWFHCVDLGSQLVSVMKEFFASEQYRTGKPISGSLDSSPPFQLDNERKLELPINLKEWLLSNKKEIQEKGWKRLYGTHYETDVIIYGKGHFSVDAESTSDIFLWQLEGSSSVILANKILKLRSPTDTLLISKGMRCDIEGQKKSLLLAVAMGAQNKTRTA